MEEFEFTPKEEPVVQNEADFTFTPKEEPDFSKLKADEVVSPDGTNTNASQKMNAVLNSWIGKGTKIYDAAYAIDQTRKSATRGIFEIEKNLGTLAKVAGDNLSLLERNTEKMLNSGGTIGTLLKLMGGNLNAINDKGYTEGEMCRLRTVGDSINEIGDLVQKHADSVLNNKDLQLDEEITKGDFMENPSWTRAFMAMGNAMPSLLGMGVLAKISGPLSAYFVMAGVDSADVYEKAKEKDTSQTEANLRFGSSVVATAAIDKVLGPLEHMMKASPNRLSKKLAKYIFDGALESVAEGLQTGAQNAFQIYDSEDIQNLGAGVIESMIGGFGSGAVASSLFSEARDNLKKQGATDEDINTLLDVFGMSAQQNADKLSQVAFQEVSKGLKEFDKFIEEKMGTPEAQKALKTKAELQDVYDAMYNTMIQAGRPEAEAKSISQIWQGIALFGSQETEMTPMEYLRRNSPKAKAEKYAEFKKNWEAVRNKVDNAPVNPFKLLMDKKAYDEAVKAEKARKGKSLLAFIKKQGGVIDEGGDLKSRDAIRQYPGLVNNKNGLTLDDMALLAWEAGYLNGETDYSGEKGRPSINTLLEAIDDELSGVKHYANDTKEKSVVDLVDDMAQAMDELGIDYSNMSAKEAEEAYWKAADDYVRRAQNMSDDEEAAAMADYYANGDDKLAQKNEIDEWADIPFQFAGEKAQTAALDELDNAKQLEADGVDNEEIRQQTGWFKGVDGKWRFEISDREAKIMLENAIIRVMNELLQSATEAQVTHPNNEYLKKEIIDYKQKLKNLELFGNDYAFDYLKENGSLNTTLGEILSHNKLYSAYPDLKNMKIEFRDGLEGSAVGAYNPYKNSIALDIDYVKTPRKLKSVLLHEIQHAIQHIENFATGGNLSSFDSIAFRERLKYQEHMRNLLFKAIKDKFGKGIEFDYWDIVSMDGMENPSVFFDEYDLNGINKKELSNFIKETLPSLNEKMDEYKKDILTRVPKNEVEFYKRLFGEVEARNTQARMNMTDAQRKASTPESTQDVKNADAIVVFGDGTEMAYEPKSVANNNIMFQGGEIANNNPANVTNRDNPTRITQRDVESFLPEEQEAFESFLSKRPDKDRILKNLKEHKYDSKGKITGYYKNVIEGIFIQEAIDNYFTGKPINFESALDAGASKLKETLESKEFKLAKTDDEKIEIIRRDYLKGGSILGHPAKVVNSVNSSLINCNPSPACAQFCYAVKGNYSYIANMPRKEVLDIIARKNPKKLAQWIAQAYKATVEYSADKALRLFDVGDGNEHWVEVAKELNRQGIRVAIFTKKPDFMRDIKKLKDESGQETNLTMLSIDSTNEQLAKDNKDLDVAYVYQGEGNLKFVKELQEEGRLSVVLPVKLGSKYMSDVDVKKLTDAGIKKSHICPIDAGWQKLHKANDKTPQNMRIDGELQPVNVGEWNCALCDRFGGVGCYFKKTTRQLKEILENYRANGLTNATDDVNILIDGLGKILQSNTFTEGLSDEIIKQLGITDEQIAKRAEVLQGKMGNANARVFAGFSIILERARHRQSELERSAKERAAEAGLLGNEARPSIRDNGNAQDVLRESENNRKAKQADVRGISGDISADSGRGVLNNNDVNYQSAWHGGRELEGGKFSLKYAGKQVGLAHGYGVYASANVAPATGYRSMVDENITYKGKNIAEVERELRNAKENDKANLVLDFAYKQNREELDKEDYSPETWTWFENEFLPNVESKGKLYEVDVPEDAQLIEENKKFTELPEDIQQNIRKVFNELSEKQINKIVENNSWLNKDKQGHILIKKEDLIQNMLEGEVNSGGAVYGYLSDALGSGKAASELLAQNGVKGIAYYDNTDGRCFVIFNPKDVKVIQKFYQNAEKGKGLPKGAFTPDNVIHLFEGADASTFMHETAHWFRAELKRFGTERSREMLRKVDAWENAEFDKRYKVELKDGAYAIKDQRGNLVYDRQFNTEEEARDYGKNEIFARGFEQYLRTGKAPNSYLKNAFKSFWNWLRTLYRSAKQLNADINQDIEDVYGTILGGEELDFYLNETPERALQQKFADNDERAKLIDENIARAQAMATEPKMFENFVAERTESKKGKAEFLTNLIVPISTRAKRVSQGLKNRLRAYDYALPQKLNEYNSRIKPFMDKWAKFNQDDMVAFDLALKNDYVNKQLAILEKYDAVDDFEAVHDLLNLIYDEAKSVGVDIGYRENYFPREVADVDGLMSYLYGPSAVSELRRAEREAHYEDMLPEEQAEFVNKFLRGYERKDLTKSLPGNVKERRIDVVTSDMNVFYKNSMQALMTYIERMTNSIESRRFWGMDAAHIDESIGAFVDDMIARGEIKPEQDKEVENILRARFKARGVSNKFLLYQKNMAYIYTMGGINSAITQIDDISVALYKAGLWNTVQSIFAPKHQGLSREELGLTRIGEEFMEASASSKAVSAVFKATGLDKIDAFGKNVLINATFKKFQKMANSDEAKLREYLEPIMEQETDATIEAIKNDEITDNVKLLMFNELADMQPISLSEMPEYYLRSGNGRVLYMLKTFALKRIDIFRNEAFDEMRKGNVKGGVQNLFKLSLLMMLCGMGKDALIDLLFGRKIILSDAIVNNLLGLFGFSKYQLYRARSDGFTGLLTSVAVPPILPMYSDLFKDMYKSLFTKNGEDIENWEVWKGIPIIGRFYYWWMGGGYAKEQKKKKKLK